MPETETEGVTPRPSHRQYVYENLGMVEVDTDNARGRVEADFRAGASLEEGVSGVKAIDTTYENFSEDIVDGPRSETLGGGEATVSHDAPRPIDLNRYPHRRY